jgi:peptide/nickel transport system substrate-binding protein
MHQHQGRPDASSGNGVSRRSFLVLCGLGASASLVATLTAPAVTSFAAPQPSPIEMAAFQAQPQSGGDLVMANWDEPISLDPVNINGPGLNAMNMVYDRLVMVGKDATGNLQWFPALADSWEQAPDGLSYTFHLKPNVGFHDGTPFNAQAVQFNLDRATAPDVKGIFQINIAGPYDHTEVVDDLTAKVVLKQPFAPFMTAIADGFYGMVSPTAVQKYGQDYDHNPVGTGPFTFVEWADKSHVTVQNNPNYQWASSIFQHQGPAYLNSVSVRLIPDSTIRMTTVETGEVNVAVDIPPEELDRLRGDSNLTVIANPASGEPGWIEINTPHMPVDDARVRQAIMWTVNPVELSNVLYKGAYPPAYTPIQPGTFGHDDSLADVYPNRPDKSKAMDLLDQAGWTMGSNGIRQKNGQNLETTINIVSASIQALPIKMAELVQAELKDVGITFTPKQFDTAALFQELLAASEMMTYAWGTSPDPDSLRALLHSSFIGNSVTQRVGYRDPHLDQLLEQGSQEQDNTKRLGIYHDIQQLMMQQALTIPMWYRLDTFLTRSNVNGFIVEPYGYPQLYDAWMAS